MLELDMVLARFMDQHFNQLTVPEIEAYRGLLAYPDPDLWALIQGGRTIEGDNEMAQIIRLLRLY